MCVSRTVLWHVGNCAVVRLYFKDFGAGNTAIYVNNELVVVVKGFDADAGDLFSDMMM